MQKSLIVLMLLMGVCINSEAKKSKSLKKVLTLKAEGSGGTNGAAVAYNTDLQLYYAAMAGNTYFPMFVYNAEGKLISDTSLQTRFDVRGLWYNPTTKTLQSNGYYDFGMGEYKTDAKGIPVSIHKLPAFSRQPNNNSTGSYSADRNEIYFYDNDSAAIIIQDANADITTLQLHLGVKKKSKIKSHPNSESSKNYNENTCIYIGTRHAEIGLLNFNDRQLELYSKESGLLKKIIPLPPDAPLEKSLNFSYCNGIYWFFDKKKREWRGYQS